MELHLDEILRFVRPTLYLPRDADDLAIDDVEPDAESFADEISAREVPACECFVHDAHSCSTASVIVGERSTRDHRQFERAEVTRADDLKIGLRAHTVRRRWSPDDIECRSADLRSPQGTCCQGYAADRRNRAYLSIDGVVELDERFAGGISGPWRQRRHGHED